MAKKKIIIAIVVLAALIGIGIAAIPRNTKIEPASASEPSSVVILYGEEESVYPAYIATLFGHEIDLVIDDNIDYSTVGDYRITYTAQLFGYSLQTKTIGASVMDMDAPVIDLEEGAVIFVKTGEEYNAASYNITDNYCSAADMDIQLSGGFDTSEKGIYETKITACDAFGNCSAKKVVLAVGDISEAEFEPGKFNLFAYDYGHVILRQEEPYMTDEEFEKVFFVGDSNTVNLGMYDAIPSDRVIARYALSPPTFHLPVYYKNEIVYRDAPGMVGITKPEIIILNMGEAELGAGNPIKFAEEYKECLKELQTASPDTKIYVSAIFPIVKGETEYTASQKEINRANYCLMKTCGEMGIPMIYYAEILMNEEGYGDPGMYQSDGYHLDGSYYGTYFDYIKNTIK